MQPRHQGSRRSALLFHSERLHQTTGLLSGNYACPLLKQLPNINYSIANLPEQNSGIHNYWTLINDYSDI